MKKALLFAVAAVLSVATTAKAADKNPVVVMDTSLGTIKIDNILVRRFVDEESRPTSTIDLEEARP